MITMYKDKSKASSYEDAFKYKHIEPVYQNKPLPNTGTAFNQYYNY